jgi:hypothetical protein
MVKILVVVLAGNDRIIARIDTAGILRIHRCRCRHHPMKVTFSVRAAVVLQRKSNDDSEENIGDSEEVEVNVHVNLVWWMTVVSHLIVVRYPIDHYDYDHDSIG